MEGTNPMLGLSVRRHTLLSRNQARNANFWVHFHWRFKEAQFGIPRLKVLFSCLMAHQDTIFPCITTTSIS